MANRRMFTKQLNEDLKFEKLSVEGKWMVLISLLYADDDGYIKVKDILHHSGVDQSVLSTLEPDFLIVDNEVAFIKIFQETQTLQGDRYTPSVLSQYHKIKTQYKFKSKKDRVNKSES